MKKLSILFVMTIGVTLMTSGKNPKTHSKEKPQNPLIGTTWQLANDFEVDEEYQPDRFLEFRKDMTFESRQSNGGFYNGGKYSLFDDSTFITIHGCEPTANYYNFTINNDTLRFHGDYLKRVFSSLDNKYYYRLEPVNEVWVRVTEQKSDLSQNEQVQSSSNTNQNALSNVALNDKDVDVRKLAVRKLTNQNVLSNIALNDKDSEIRKLALKCMK